MGKSKSDSIRSGIDIVVKVKHEKSDVDDGDIPIGGCEYYGDLKLMAEFCLKCNDRDKCY